MHAFGKFSGPKLLDANPSNGKQNYINVVVLDGNIYLGHTPMNQFINFREAS